MKLSAAVLLLIAIGGCAKPPVEYRPIPYHLIPERPQLPVVLADELRCLKDETYLNLAERDLLLRKYSEELGALLGAQ
ncbi:MAG: hypothetical protein ABTR07_10300 [Candidatus Competibacter denitrificans]